MWLTYLVLVEIDETQKTDVVKFTPFTTFAYQ